jgi:hypothetical protein
MASPASFMQADRLKFPGMLPAEVLVFKAWLALHEKEYDRIEYNKHVGAGIDPGPNVDPYWRDLALKSTQLRMDAVAWQASTPTLIEVKRRAGPRNIGQLVTYSVLWAADFPNLPKAKLLLVASDYQPNIEGVAAHLGITIEKVSTDFSKLRPATFARKAGIDASTDL